MKNARVVALLLCSTLVLALGVPVSAWAAEPKDRFVVKEATAAKVQDVGWDVSLAVGGTFNLITNTNVVGQQEGVTFTLGFQVLGGLDYIKDAHEWRNTLKLADTFSRTPATDRFTKNADLLQFESIYLYKFASVPWIGPFARFKLNTQILPTYDVRVREGGRQSYVINQGLADEQVLVDQDSLRLGSAFQPLIMKQVLGAYAKPISRKNFSIVAKLGFEARETFADGALAIDKVTDFDVLVKRLKDFSQGGPSLGVSLRGKRPESRISYYIDVEAMIPVINDLEAGDNRNAIDLTNFELEAGASVKVFSWMSIDYQLRVIRQPQLLDKWQVQNNVLATFSYTLLESDQDKKKK